MNMEGLKAGISYTSRIVVDKTNTAARMGSGDMDVFATPAMIALMENAAAMAVKDFLEEGMTTVGTRIDVSHTKATAAGSTVKAEAVLEEIDGRRLVFSVIAYDSSEETIGRGMHERFIVNREKFLSRL